MFDFMVITCPMKQLFLCHSMRYQSVIIITCLIVRCTGTTVKCSLLDVSRLRAHYIKHLSTDHTDWPLQYVRLALVKGEKVTRADKNLEEITRLTLQGKIDELLLRKELFCDLRDIFHYENKPCSRLILIMGGPGEY